MRQDLKDINRLLSFMYACVFVFVCEFEEKNTYSPTHVLGILLEISYKLSHLILITTLMVEILILLVWMGIKTVVTYSSEK